MFNTGAILELHNKPGCHRPFHDFGRKTVGQIFALQISVSGSNLQNPHLKKIWVWWLTCHPSPGELGTGGSLGLTDWPAQSTWQVPYHGETLSQAERQTASEELQLREVEAGTPGLQGHCWPLSRV